MDVEALQGDEVIAEPAKLLEALEEFYSYRDCELKSFMPRSLEWELSRQP